MTYDEEIKYELMIDHLEDVQETFADYSDDEEDNLQILIEEIDKALRRGVINSVVHEKLYWQFGLDI